jgi:hypothetical protein
LRQAVRVADMLARFVQRLAHGFGQCGIAVPVNQLFH